ncbi:MAG TPA: methyltransferase domain-containing protein [Marinagarivorans sp.]|nr:methyltransferase domain-containing protein [Marinagarivorans sp.]
MHDLVQNYYGQQLTNSQDLKTSACCDISQVPEWLKPLLAKLHPAVVERYYGCGLVCPSDLSGLRVLDLGCGAGRDVFLLSQLVGEGGEVVGVDMTSEQLAVARDYQAYHAEQFGFDNVRFVQGYIEQLDQLGLEAGSFDLVVSNCVVNLSPDKPSVLAGVARLLKPGGELYFSDVYCDRRLPEALRQDPVLYGECLGGALYWNDFTRLAKQAGFNDPRLVEDRPLEITDPVLAERLGEHRFYSATYRLFNLPQLEDACEDYGQAVRYKGTCQQQPHAFVLDKHHRFVAGKLYPVCGNSHDMLKLSRLAQHFEFFGDNRRHFGLFEGCGSSIPFTQTTPTNAACC